MKKIIALLAIAFSSVAFASGSTTPPQVIREDALPTMVAPCWVQLTVNTVVDGRRISGFTKSDYEDTVNIFVGALNDYNSVKVNVGKGDRDAYIQRIQQEIQNCYK
jgi:hypothetical protein